MWWYYLPYLIAIYLFFEVINYYYFYLDLIKLTKKKKLEPIDPDYDPDYMITYLKEIPEDDLKDWLTNSLSYIYLYDPVKTGQYYNFVKIDEIPKTNFLKWVAYHIYFRSFNQLTNTKKEKAIEIAKYLEDNKNLTLKSGYNEDIFFPKFGKSYLNARYKPVIFYLFYFLNSVYVYFYLRYYSFTYDRSKNNILYVKYKHKTAKTTVYFVHGFGIGIGPYLELLIDLSKSHNLIIPILPNISNMDLLVDFFKKPGVNTLFPPLKAWKEDYESFKLKKSKTYFIGHSFGSVIYGLLYNLEFRFNKAVLIDPVCFTEGSYKIFKYVNEPYDPNSKLSSLIKYLIYDDIYVRYLISKYLDGPMFMLKSSKLDSKYFIILSELDAIVPVNILLEILKENSIKYDLLKNTIHGDFINKDKDEILNFLK